MAELITARQAFDAGLTRYFTGEPCKYGHTVERLVANGCCAECLRLRDQEKRKKTQARVKQWRLDNPEAVKEQAKRFAKKHPETNIRAKKKYRKTHLEEIRKRDRENHKRIRLINPEKERERLARFKTKQDALKVGIIYLTPMGELATKAKKENSRCKETRE